MPDNFIFDVVSVVVFAVLLILLVAFGVKLIDFVWTKIKLEEQVEKGNLSAGIVMAAIVFGICYAMAEVVKSIIG